MFYGGTNQEPKIQRSRKMRKISFGQKLVILGYKIVWLLKGRSPLEDSVFFGFIVLDIIT